MGYRVINPSEVEEISEDRPCRTRAITGAKGNVGDFQHLGLRLYDPDPGEQIPLKYHYHENQDEAFYVISGTMHVETPEGDFVVDEGEIFLVEPGSPHRAFNPTDAAGPIQVLAVGAPTTDPGQQYQPET